jgi:iron complex outermembrane recepter protein
MPLHHRSSLTSCPADWIDHGNLDPSGRALPKATAVIHQASGSVSKQVSTDGQGQFSVDSLPVGTYTVEVTSQGFASAMRTGVQVTAGQPSNVSVQLSVGNVSQQVTVSAADSDSIAAQLSPIQVPLDAESPRSEFGTEYIKQFSSPVSDYGTVLQMAPGTFSISPNGIGLGQDRTYFRGFADGNYDITWDGIPFNDTNGPTHHSWAFFPSQWLGGIDFDRSPGTASTVGPTPFGGSINLLSKDVPDQQSLRSSVAYGSFNTLLLDGQYDSGPILGNKKAGLSLDLQRLTSDGFQTFNHQQRIAGAVKLLYKFSDKLVLTGFSGWVMLDNNTPNTVAPTRAQVAAFGYNFLLNNDPTSPYYYGYNGYHLPTNFEYVGFLADLGHGWKLDVKPYTYSYKNHQWYTTPPIKTPTGGVNPTFCSTPVSGILPCASDQVNGYHKYAEVSSVSQTSPFGVFTAGIWYEWASTHRYLYPTNPFTRAFGNLPSYRESFTTNSYQPFVEYSYRAFPGSPSLADSSTPTTPRTSPNTPTTAKRSVLRPQARRPSSIMPATTLLFRTPPPTTASCPTGPPTPNSLKAASFHPAVSSTSSQERLRPCLSLLAPPPIRLVPC